jgi:outer membrane protein TolC
MKKGILKVSITLIILAVWGIFITLFLGQGEVYAESISAISVKRATAENLTSNTSHRAIELSLRDVTELALRNSLDIQIAQFDAYIERTSLEKAQSIFDTFFEAEASYRKDNNMPSTTFLGTETIEKSFSLGMEKRIPTGTILSIDASQTKNKTDNPFSVLNPYHEAILGFSITQSIGKNFFGLADRARVKISRLDIENSDYTSLDSIERTLYNVQKAYWNLVFKGEQLAIKKEMLKEAEKLYKIYKDKFSLGLVEKSELLAVEALVRTRESDVEIAVLEKKTAKNELLFLINKGDFQQQIEAKDKLGCKTSLVDLYSALKKAVKHRRDYKRLKNKVEKSNIDIVVKQNALWPEIDLQASLVRNNLDTSLNQAWGDITDKNNDEFFVGISFKVPFENREAKAQWKRANLEKQRLLLSLKRVERLILQELNNKVNQVNTMHTQVELFEPTVKIHKQKLQEELKRLRQGRSQADVLIQYEEDLLKARLSLALYLFRYRISLLELELAENTLLDKYWDTPL